MNTKLDFYNIQVSLRKCFWPFENSSIRRAILHNWCLNNSIVSLKRYLCFGLSMTNRNFFSLKHFGLRHRTDRWRTVSEESRIGSDSWQ